MIDRLLTFLTRHATLVLACGVFVGLVIPPLASALRPLLVPSVFLLLSAALYRLDWPAVIAYLRRPGLAALVSVWILGVSPIAMWLVVDALSLTPSLAAALVLLAAAPPIISSMPFAMFLRLDAALAAMMLFAVTMLAPVTVPLIAAVLLDLDLSLSTGDLMLRLAALAGGALAVAGLMRATVPDAHRAQIERAVDGTLVVVLIIFAIGVMDGVTAALIERPAVVLAMLVAAFAANLSLQALGALVFFRLHARKALTVGLVSGNRNLALILAALAGTADLDLLMFFAVGQIPIYVLPALLKPVYERLCRSEVRT